ncbi:MAG: hypothetical protein AAF565_11545 [Pseudomonadota bacterium]
MLSILQSAAETIGRGPATLLILALALMSAAYPLMTWRLRGGWETIEAEVIGVSNRRTLASSTHAVAIHVVGEETPRDAPVQINISKHPVGPGDRVTLLRNPASGRVVRDRWDGASVPLMLAPLIAMAALALYAE